MALLCIAIACTLIMFIITFTFLIVGACCFDALYEMISKATRIDSAILEQ